MYKVTSAVAHPWLCDAQHHLNTRHYMAMFDDAAQIWLGSRTVPGQECEHDSPLGWADVRNEVDYLAEVSVGAIVDIFAQVAHLGTKSLTLSFSMRSPKGIEHARMRAVFVRFDLAMRTAVPIEPQLRCVLLPSESHRVDS